MCALGWDDRLERALALRTAVVPVAVPGRVSRVDRGLVSVITESGLVRLPLGPVLRRRRNEVDQCVAVGDWVVTSGGAVVAVLPRRSAFVRGDPERAVSKVVAANLDTVLLVHSLASPLNERRLARELALVREGGAEAVVVLTKLDLCPEVSAHVAAIARVDPRTEVHSVSNVTGEGFDGLRDLTGGGRTSALIGASGVGKSSIVNRLLGEEALATGEVREGDQRGRHTTTARRLLVLPGGGVLIDTPGLRTLALPVEVHAQGEGAGARLGEVYEDVEEVAAGCRFSDCRHDGEPGCAVAAAVRGGTLHADRVSAFLLDTSRAEIGPQRRGERTGAGRPSPPPEAGRRGDR